MIRSVFKKTIRASWSVEETARYNVAAAGATSRCISTTRRDHLIAWLAALAITIHWVESALPSPLPGVKPGLANVVTIVTLCAFGWRMACWVSLLRVLCGALISGTLLSPTFMLSASGALAALLILGIAYVGSKFLPWLALGPVGYSVLAALAHMAGQFWAAYLFFVPHQGLFHLLPIMLAVSLVFGFVSGVVAQAAVRRLHKM